MSINTDEQIADIRERVASIEATLRHIQRCMDMQQHKGTGNIVIPVALVVTVLEIVKAVIERMT